MKATRYRVHDEGPMGDVTLLVTEVDSKPIEPILLSGADVGAALAHLADPAVLGKIPPLVVFKELQAAAVMAVAKAPPPLVA